MGFHLAQALTGHGVQIHKVESSHCSELHMSERQCPTQDFWSTKFDRERHALEIDLVQSITTENLIMIITRIFSTEKNWKGRWFCSQNPGNQSM